MEKKLIEEFIKELMNLPPMQRLETFHNIRQATKESLQKDLEISVKMNEEISMYLKEKLQ